MVVPPIPSVNESSATAVNPDFRRGCVRRSDVLQCGFNYGDAAAVAIAFFCGFDAAEFDDGAAAGFNRRHAGAEIVVDVELEMAFEFGG